MSKVFLNGNYLEMDVVVNYMDDEIREKLHNELSPCTDQEFVDKYVDAHKTKFNEDFIIN